MSTTQEHLSIYDIKEDIVLLKDGGAAVVLETNAVNFGLLSEREQIAIIDAFAQTLNSLSFNIQIVIHSKRLDISSYLNLLDQAQRIQTNPLLSQMIAKYRQFIQTTIKENDVLDKDFYVVIHASNLEMGVRLSNTQLKLQKAKTLLLPRKDQISKQLNRIGLKVTQLNNYQLTKLFYEIYNQTNESIVAEKLDIQPVTLGTPQINTSAQPPTPNPTTTPTPPVQDYQQPTGNTNSTSFSNQPTTNESRPLYSANKSTPPFIVEELSDNT